MLLYLLKFRTLDFDRNQGCETCVLYYINPKKMQVIKQWMSPIFPQG